MITNFRFHYLLITLILVIPHQIDLNYIVLLFKLRIIMNTLNLVLSLTTSQTLFFAFALIDLRSASNALIFCWFW